MNPFRISEGAPPFSKTFGYDSRLVIAITLCVAALVTFLILTVFRSTLMTFEDQVGGLSWRFFSDEEVEERITIVSIDERSISEIGPWPWPRTVMADLVQGINEAGAQLQIHDIVYPAAQEGDNQFQAALSGQNNSVIAQLPVFSTYQASDAGVPSHAVQSVSCSGDSLGIFPKAEGFLGASSALSQIAKGHIAPIIDSDGAIRRTPALVCFEDKSYPALSISPFLLATGSENWSVEIKDSSNPFAAFSYLTMQSYPGVEIPLDAQGNVRFSFHKSPSAFRAVSAVDILNGQYDPAMFDNVWVLVGATAFALDDIVPTPYTGSAPGVELQARMIGSILDSKVPYVPQGVSLITVLISVVLGGVLIRLALLRGKFAVVGIPVFSLIAPVISLSVYSWALLKHSLLIGWLGPTMFAIFSGSMLVLHELVRVKFERGRVMQNLASYLPSDAARKVAFELPSSEIEASRCEVTLLCADLRNFSALSESRPPEESASVLHYFFTKVNSIVELHGGKVHEYKGDSVLAYWGSGGVTAASNALKTAQQIEREINDKLLNESGVVGLEPLAVGIGIEQGPVLMGSIGPAHRRANTLCGETVSITLRVQEMTPELATTILIGEVAARHLRDFKLQSMGVFLLPGLTTSHTLFAPEEHTELVRDKLKVLTGGLS